MRTKIFLWGAAYWVVLTVSFCWALPNHWSGFYLSMFDSIKFLAATILMLGLLAGAPRENDIAAFYVYIVLFLVVFPIGVLYTCRDGSTVYFGFVAISFFLVEVSIDKMKIRSFHFSVNKRGKQNYVSQFLIWISVLLILLTLVSMFRARGIPSLRALDFSQTYDIRASYTLTSEGSQLYQISSRVLVPFLIAISFYKKQYKNIIALLFVQFLLFLWLAHKTLIFSLAILAVAYLFAKSEKRTLIFSQLLTIGVGVLTLLEGMSSDVSQGFSKFAHMAYSLIVRRSIFVPAYLKHCYYTYFVRQEHPLAGFFGTLISPFLTRMNVYDPYKTVSYTKVIGRLYENGSNANTGVFGKELAHFGIVGIFVAALCLLLFFLCVKSSEGKNGKEFTCCLSLYLVMSFPDAGSIALVSFSPLFWVALLLVFFDFGEYQKNDPGRLDQSSGPRKTYRKIRIRVRPEKS